MEKIVPLPLQGLCVQPASQVWDCSLSFAPGSRTLAKAGSGRGKTTLLSILFGMRKDYLGVAFFDGKSIRELDHTGWSGIRINRLSCVFQDLQLFDDLTALQNVQVKNCLTAHKSDEEVRQMFDVLGVADKISSPVSKLSRGQKQRVAILRALCQPFDFLLLDEPFSHLDRDNRARTADLILDECGKKGAGILLASLEEEPVITGCTPLNL